MSGTLAEFPSWEGSGVGRFMGRGEARTGPGIFTPFGVELLHGDSRRRLFRVAQQEFLQPGQIVGVNQVNARIE